MKRYIQFATGHPYLIAALVVVLFLPWMWMSYLIPAWALMISLALVPIAALIALALVIRDVNTEDDAHAVIGDEPFLKWRKRTRLFQQVVVGLDTMLERWDTASQANRKRLDTITESVEDKPGIDPEEAGQIREKWEDLKACVEKFVISCERGHYDRPPRTK